MHTADDIAKVSKKATVLSFVTQEVILQYNLHADD